MEIRNFEEHYFTTSDNISLYYKYWPAKNKTDKALILFHRGHEHSGRLQHIVDELNLPDIAMFAWDARGHGMSPGTRGYSPSVDRSIADVDEFVRHISANYGIPAENIIVVAQSIGAVYAIAWLHDYAPKIRGLIAASPAFDVKLYVPFARQLIALGQKIIGPFYVKSYVKARFLTHDEARINSYNSDPLITKQIATNILLEMFSTSKRIIADANAIKTPLQLFISGSDFVVRQKAVYDFFDAVGSTNKEKHVLKGFFHDTLGEKNRAQVMVKMREFIEKLYSESPAVYDYAFEDSNGISAQKWHALQKPENCPYKRLYYGFLTLMLRKFGWLSDGMRIGLNNGFDSGVSLDYVYQNKPAGRFFIGKWIDRAYLNSVGWRGVRTREQQLIAAICQTAEQLQAAGKSVRLVDVAAGVAHYVFAALCTVKPFVESVLLRDFSAENVARGQAKIAANKLDNLVKFEQGDAFSANSLAKIENKPNLAVVSGFFELFAENTGVKTTLCGLYKAMEPGGYLIYTNQPWHPQQELIARVLNSHRSGHAWIMRCRSQAEMDALVENAGFKKIRQVCSENAIFTISVAQKQ